MKTGHFRWGSAPNTHFSLIGSLTAARIRGSFYAFSPATGWYMRPPFGHQTPSRQRAGQDDLAILNRPPFSVKREFTTRTPTVKSSLRAPTLSDGKR